MAKIKLLQEEVNDRVALAQARIEAAVAAIQSGSEWRNYLKLQSSLHRYSANNVWLIASQHAAAFEQGLVDTPWPSYVAGFNTWKALDRSVSKGQHGYQILAPNRRAARVVDRRRWAQPSAWRRRSPIRRRVARNPTSPQGIPNRARLRR